jgi:hypothetical protein
MRRLIVLACLYGLALAQSTPQSIIVTPNNPPPPFPGPTPQSLTIWLDAQAYPVGSPIAIHMMSPVGGYLYVFDRNAHGRLMEIAPYGGLLYIQPGETLTLPPPGAGYTYTVTGPIGWDTVLAFVSPAPLSSQEAYQVAVSGGTCAYASPPPPPGPWSPWQGEQDQEEGQAHPQSIIPTPTPPSPPPPSVACTSSFGQTSFEVIW